MSPANRIIRNLADLNDVAGGAQEGDSLRYTDGEWVPGSPTAFTYTQNQSSAEWVVVHNLSCHPSVTIVDSAGTVVIGHVTYDSENQVTIRFSAPFGGKAYLN